MNQTAIKCYKTNRLVANYSEIAALLQLCHVVGVDGCLCVIWGVIWASEKLKMKKCKKKKKASQYAHKM